MDAAYASEVERHLEALRVALISAVTPEAEKVARDVDRHVREYLGKPPANLRGMG